jgi:hypothetical protein
MGQGTKAFVGDVQEGRGRELLKTWNPRGSLVSIDYGRGVILGNVFMAEVTSGVLGARRVGLEEEIMFQF